MPINYDEGWVVFDREKASEAGAGPLDEVLQFVSVSNLAEVYDAHFNDKDPEDDCFLPKTWEEVSPEDKVNLINRATTRLQNSSFNPGDILVDLVFDAEQEAGWKATKGQEHA